MRKGILLLLTTLFILAQNHESLSQGKSTRGLQPMVRAAGDPIICYSRDEDMFTYVPYRTKLEELTNGRTLGTEGATFEVNYDGFTPLEQAAFQYAVDIWSDLLSSDVTINIDVRMADDMPTGTLASTGSGGYYANFKNAQKLFTWYVVSMAEKIAGEDLNDPEDADIRMSFNVNRPFYVGLDANPPAGTFDLVTIALHEIGHGLGYSALLNVSGGVGEFIFGNPSAYGSNVENGEEENLFDTYATNGAELGAQLTGDDLYFRSFTFEDATLPQIYAPAAYNGGSSIAHLDEDKYESGNPHSLMTPQVGFAEAIHDPGLSLNMLEDLGWTSMDIDHNALLDTEDGTTPHTITAVISGDNAVNTDSITLHYTTTNWGAGEELTMLSTGNLNEYSAEIPASGLDVLVSYYIAVHDLDERYYTNPGEAPEYFNQFAVAVDTIKPVLLHQPLSIVFVNDPVAKIVATVRDNMGTNPLIMTYKINSGDVTNIEIPIIELVTDGNYVAEHYYEWDLSALNVQKGDIVKYQLSVTDIGSNANTAIHPAEDIGFNEIQIDGLNPVVNLYFNDFNAATEDFVGAGFEIGTEDGFSNGLMHSDHPYRTTAGVSSVDTLILYQLLKSPIVISSFDPSITFDEVVLVEPGEPGNEFGDAEFWDYVIVEGSSDLGVTWKPMVNGYDAGAYSTWFDHYNSDLVNEDFNGTLFPNSAAVGSESLFRHRVIDMLENGNFEAGDTVLLRFKLYADQLATGWGWGVDNLKIQIDNEKPVIKHIAQDYLSIGDTEMKILTMITDNSVLDSMIYEIDIDGNSQILGVDVETDLYELNLSFNAITANSKIKYRIIAVDSATNPNTAYLPETGYFDIPVAAFGETKTSYLNDFNGGSDDFIGYNFSVETVDGFDDEAMHSPHSYPNTIMGSTTLSYLLKYPIKTNATSSWMRFREIVMVQPTGDDGVAVEVSNDNGTTWHEVVEKYSVIDNSAWNTVFSLRDDDGNSVGAGNSSLYRDKLINLLNPEAINGGDEILVRFSLTTDSTLFAWGWVIDDLEIQGPTTAIEEADLIQLSVFPNPSAIGRFELKGTLTGGKAEITLTDLLGKEIIADEISSTSGKFEKSFDVTGVRKGVYLLSVRSGEGIQTRRVVIK